ncbi:MAG: phage holin family protein [Bacteroidota bacterium]
MSYKICHKRNQTNNDQRLYKNYSDNDMNFFTRLLLSSVAVIIATYLLPGIAITGNSLDAFITSFIVAIIISLLNVTIKPILIIFTIPITVITLGLFLLVINAFVIMIVSAIVPGFIVDNFWWALIFSILLTIINALLTDLSKKH